LVSYLQAVYKLTKPVARQPFVVLYRIVFLLLSETLAAIQVKTR